MSKVEVVEVTRSIVYGYHDNSNVGNAFLASFFMPFIIVLGSIAAIIFITIICVVLVSAKKRKVKAEDELTNSESDSSQSDK